MKKRILIILNKPNKQLVLTLKKEMENFKRGDFLIMDSFKIVSCDDELLILEDNGIKST
jgi:hypothetical protein